mmetsp:Transcript_72400/g.125525  ORF Transcript_72400/g.125525 Transcript_72400/m.125525 type:complete len:298 (+) Transcript_72400:159-1052(+)
MSFGSAKPMSAHPAAPMPVEEVDSGAMEAYAGGEGGQGLTTSVHEANRVKKAVESNVKLIENRIRFFQREEEKIWRDLEEVRRQAATIEEGRSRTLEKKLADRTIQQARESALSQNRAKAASQKQANIETRRRNQFAQMQDKQEQGQEQRRISQDNLRKKKMNEAQARLYNSERAVAIQRQQLEARLKVNQERAMKLEMLRMEQDAERLQAEADCKEVESRLPALEEAEKICLQRLQNSRIVTQSVLEELESSLGNSSSVTSMLRAKQRQQADPMESPEEVAAQSPGMGPMGLAPIG